MGDCTLASLCAEKYILEFLGASLQVEYKMAGQRIYAYIVGIVENWIVEIGLNCSRGDLNRYEK